MDLLEQIKTELDRIGRDCDALGVKLTADMDAKIDRLANVLRRANARGLAADLPREKTVEDKAFDLWLRKGQEALGPEQIKALTVASDPSGGYLAPAALSLQVDHYIRELSAILQRCRQYTFSAGEMELPRVTSGPTATWVGEIESTPETSMALGTVSLVMGELRCYVDMSLRLLEDSAITLDQLLAEELGGAFAAAANQAVLVGNGVKKPLGLLVSTTMGVNKVMSGHASQITSDGMIDMTTAIPASLLLEPVWVMNRATAGVVRKLRNAVDGAYMWQPGLQLGQPASLLGYEVMIDENMPNVAAGAWPIVFGSFRRGLAVASKPGTEAVSIMRDPFTMATFGQVRFHARKRLGAVVAQGRAFAKMEIGTP